MYIDRLRLKVYLSDFLVPPTPSAERFAPATWPGLEIPAEPPVIHEGSIFAGQSARMIKASLNEKPVIVMQWYGANVEGRWYTVNVWDVPVDFDWTVMFPDFSSEAYSPKANRLSIALSEDLKLEVWAKLPEVMNTMSFDARLVSESGIKTPFINLSVPFWPTSYRAAINWVYTYKSVPEEFAAYYNLGKSDYVSLKLTLEQIESIKSFMMAECARLRDEVLQAIDNKTPLSANCFPILSMMIDEAHIMDSTGLASCYDLSPLTIAELYRANMKEKQERDAVWDERESNGVIVVALRRCWECGRTQIMGELKRGGRIERMPKDLWQKAANAQGVAHAKSVQAAQGEIISSIGFENTDSRFEFVVVDDDWYDGC
jgi:hypothetical protein